MRHCCLIQNHCFTDRQVFNIGKALISIIKHIHSKGVVNRDIRKSNVILNGDDVFLVDFGLARWADGHKYRYDADYSYLGHLLLYLLYSSYKAKKRLIFCPWYIELPLDKKRKTFLKKLLKLDLPYDNINTLEADFIKAFWVNS